MQRHATNRPLDHELPVQRIPFVEVVLTCDSFTRLVGLSISFVTQYTHTLVVAQPLGCLLQTPTQQCSAQFLDAGAGGLSGWCVICERAGWQKASRRGSIAFRLGFFTF